MAWFSTLKTKNGPGEVVSLHILEKVQFPPSFTLRKAGNPYFPFLEQVHPLNASYVSPQLDKTNTRHGEEYLEKSRTNLPLLRQE